MTALQDGLHVLSPTATTVPSLSAVIPLKSTPLGVDRRLQLVPSQCSVKLPPIAQMSLAETAAIPLNRLLRWFAGNGFIVGTTFQLEPFQCAIASNASGCSPLLEPAAQTLIGESAVTASPTNIDGEAAWLQVWPFQCRVIAPATAQTSLLESAEIPRTPPTPVNARLETTFQLTPFQCSIKSAESSYPAAQTSLDEIAVTVVKKAPCPTLGPETTFQLVPFQCSINVVIELPDACWPTAHTSLLLTPSTANNSPPWTAGHRNDAPAFSIEMLDECHITARRAPCDGTNCPDVVVRDRHGSAQT
jgi:hypothetical protein